MASKRQTTMAKLERERAVRERRARKLEKREEKKAARLAQTAPDAPETVSEEAGSEETVEREP